MTDPKEIKGPRYFRRHVRQAHRRGTRRQRRHYARILRFLRVRMPRINEGWPEPGPR